MYLGPVIVAQKNWPVRIKFTNNLPLGAAGNLFVPNDVTIMGAGTGALNTDFATTADVLCKKDATGVIPAMCYSENRATIHLHGGVTPWISDGTPHQWITPAGETMSAYKEGVSVYNVPDMPNPGKPGDPLAGATNTGSGSQTFYFTNDQSARLMFYHDHASGTTRLNVYIGEAAGYLLQDPTEADLVARGLIPAEQIPLIIQEKAFVDPLTIAAEDPTWNSGTGTPALYTDVRGNTTMLRPPMAGDLWWPHVYMPAQNPYDISGMNAMGRWHYGPWFWPPTVILRAEPVHDPSTRHGSRSDRRRRAIVGAEGFLDTPVSTARPTRAPSGPAYFPDLNAARSLHEPGAVRADVDRLGDHADRRRQRLHRSGAGLVSGGEDHRRGHGQRRDGHCDRGPGSAQPHVWPGHRH
jgi:FtsP/CotA-like multicopper oxidase with cupredoxin domain